MKRTLAMLLACVMLIGALPVSAFAQELEIINLDETAVVEEAEAATVPETEVIETEQTVPETEAAETAPETQATETVETVPATEPAQTVEETQIPDVQEQVLTGESTGQLSGPESILAFEELIPALHADMGALDVGDHVMSESEPNNAMNTANTVYNDYTVNGFLTSTSDADYFKFTVSGSKSVTVVAVSNSPYMRLRMGNSDAEVIGADDSGSSTQSGNYSYGLTGTLTSGTYYIVFDTGYSSCGYTFYVSLGGTNGYTVTYNANGGTGAPMTQTATNGSVTLSETQPVRIGYAFKGWATSSSASSASYYPGRSYTISSNITLYAVWEAATAIPATVSNSNYSATISFSGGYKLYSFRPTAAKSLTFESSGSADTYIEIQNSSGSTIASNDDGGTNYNFKLTHSFSANTTYYIKVRYLGTETGTINFNVKSGTGSSGSYTISYNVNGASGLSAPSSHQTNANGALTVNGTVLVRTGYTFLGWAASSSATTASYLPGVSYTFTDDTTLYAVWQAATALSTSSSSSNYTAAIAFNNAHQMYSFRSTVSSRVTFESSGSADTRIYIYSASGSQLATDDDGGTNANFKLTYTFSANTTYYIMVRYYGTGTGSITFNVANQNPVSSGYTITYYPNGGSGSSATQTTTAAGEATVPKLDSYGPTRTGYTLLGYSTSSSATTASYLPGVRYTFSGNTSLYAVWEAAAAIPATVTNSNYSAVIAYGGGYKMYSFCPTSTTSLTFESSVNSDTYISVMNSSGSQVASDDDSGTDYNFKLTYSFSANTTYYIKIRYLGDSNTGTINFNVKNNNPTTYTVTYNANGGSGAPSSQTKTHGTALTLSGTVPTRFGYNFQGWGTSSTDTTADYQPGGSYTENASITLYAVWETAPVIPADVGSQSYSPRLPYADRFYYYSFRPTAATKLVFESTGSLDTKIYIFNASGTQQAYDDDGSNVGNNFKLTYSFAANNTYYIGVRFYGSSTTGTINFTAKRYYTVSYNANGGSGAPASQEKLHGTNLTLSSTRPTKSGSTFYGWGTSTSDTTPDYQPGGSYTANADIALYAIWQAPKTVTGIAIATNPTKTTYQIGESFDATGLTVRVNYSDNTSEVISTGFTVSGFSSATAGTKTITVTYENKTATFTVTVAASEPDPTDANIRVSTPTGAAGQQVNVTIALENNPGIASMRLAVDYDSDVLTLVSVTDAEQLGTAVHSDNLEADPYMLTWANDLATTNYTYNGTIVTLTFQVAEDAEAGRTPVTVSYDYDNYDIFDVDTEKVYFNVLDGYVEITDVVIGDVNGDGRVNTQDRMVLTRYLAMWTGYGEDTINTAAADVNSDGRVNTQDRMILTRHLALWSGYEDLPYTG